MPYFRVMLEGKGIDIPSENKSIIGFITTRFVWASTTVEAENKAKEIILSEWSSGKYAKANKGL